tara:strand:+ start:370 stop:543 length:174 start_codon:yes stop_codon:yes gene_type:complete
VVFGALVEDLIKVVEARGEYLARVWRWKSKEVAFELNKGLVMFMGLLACGGWTTASS